MNQSEADQDVSHCIQQHLKVNSGQIAAMYDGSNLHDLVTPAPCISGCLGGGHDVRTPTE
jgi:hypothetical protein